ncbi:MAG: hypothetical protein ACPGUV_12505, partial [Polyangiales bacterium]
MYTQQAISPDARPLLTVAAESIALRDAGSPQTVLGLVRGRALHHYGAALQQYLAIRLGSIAASERALQALADRVERWEEKDTQAGSGMRARLFREARV